MAYKTLSQNEQIDAIVQTYKANEMDLFIQALPRKAIFGAIIWAAVRLFGQPVVKPDA